MKPATAVHMSIDLIPGTVYKDIETQQYQVLVRVQYFACLDEDIAHFCAGSLSSPLLSPPLLLLLSNDSVLGLSVCTYDMIITAIGR